MRLSAVLVTLAFCACRHPSARQPGDIYRESSAALRLGDFERAADLIRKGSESASPQWIPTFRVLRAELFAFRGNYKEAFELLQQTPIPDSSAELAIRRKITLAQCQCSLRGKDFNVTGARENLRSAQELSASSADPEVGSEIEIIGARCSIGASDLERAEESYLHVLSDAGEKHLPLMRAYALAGLAYLRIYDGRFDDAADYTRTSLQLSYQAGSSLLITKNLHNLGLSYVRVGDYDNALPLLQSGEKIARQRGYGDDLQRILASIGNLYYFRRDYSTAARYYEEALRLAREIEPARQVAQMLTNLADCAVLRGHFDEAERYNNEGLALKLSQRERTTVQHSRLTEARIAAGRGYFAQARSIYKEIGASHDSNGLLKLLSHADLAALYMKKSMKAQAEPEFREAIRVMERSRDELKDESSKMSFLSSLAEVYSSYIGFEVMNHHAERALEIADRGRAQRLKEKTGNSTGATPAVAASALRRKARSLNAVFLSYWLTPTQSYLWTISPDRIELFELPGEENIQRLVDEHQQRIARHRDLLHEDEGHAGTLYRTLIGPAEKLIRRDATVIIVPDGALNRLNFETLIVDTPARHYWIEDVTVAIAPALGIVSTGPSGAPSQLEPALLIGDPVPPSADFPKLPYAAREIEQVSKLFPDDARTIISGSGATPAAFRLAHPEKFGLIHFAAHATANRETPLGSAVILSQSKEGFRLYASDVMRTPLDTSLVTISACSSAGAKSFSGEGLVGLAWAFLSAGAHSVIAGLWDVEDASTAQMMEQLYREIQHGAPPAVALRSAKLTLIHSRDAYRKPFYWAPFVLFTRRAEPLHPSSSKKGMEEASGRARSAMSAATPTSPL